MRRGSWAVMGLLAAVSAGAAPAGTGIVARPAECDFADPTGSEFIVARACSTSSRPDLLWDIGAKGGRRSDEQTILYPDGWSHGDVFRAWARDDIRTALVLLPPTGGDLGCRLYVDSQSNATIDAGAAEWHRVGDSLRTGLDAGIGLMIPGTRTTYPVSIAGVLRRFPERKADGSVTIAFAPLPEVNGNDAIPGCDSIAGAFADPEDPSPNDFPPVAGRIIGYNVYRIPACALTEGSRQEFARALADLSPRTGWVGFADLRTFRLSARNDGSVSPGPNDLAPSDPVELINPDGRMYSGDEVILFTDAAATARPDPLRAPRPDQAYFYAVQPVWRGTVESFADIGFTLNDLFHGDHRRDLDRDGGFDAIDLDMGCPGGVEFISPQHDAENGALDGLGLTLGGMPLTSAPMFAAPAVPSRFPPECVALPRPLTAIAAAPR